MQHFSSTEAAERIVLAFNGKTIMRALESIAGCEILVNVRAGARTDDEKSIYSSCAGLPPGEALEAMRLARHAILTCQIVDCRTPSLDLILASWRMGEARGRA